MDRNYTNRKCPACGWYTMSFVSRGYKYCPKCSTPLIEFDMRKDR